MTSVDDAAEEEKETKWTDACIRWEEDELAPQKEEEEEERPFDPFADPDPTQEFSFQFSIPGGPEISISLNGYKADADESWQSTGLTLWRASHHLNEYILQHAAQWKNKRILELGAGLGVCGILTNEVIAASEKVDDAGTVGYASDIVIDSNDHIHVLYEELGDARPLHLATREGGAWSSFVLSSSGFGQDLSVGVDSTDRLHVVFNDEHGELSYMTNRESTP